MGDPCGCRNPKDETEYCLDRRNDQSTEEDDLEECDLPAKTHKTVLPALPALVPTSQIPLSNTQIESAACATIKE